MALSDTVRVQRFAGFPDRMELVPIPGAVFGTLLREIQDLAELKTLLHVLRLLHEQRRAPRFVRRSSLLVDAGLAEALGAEHDEVIPMVTVALELAVGRGTLLALDVTDGGTADTCYLLNTRINVRTVQQVVAGERALGDLEPAATPREPAQAGVQPSIFELYEQNIGLLTPLLSEELAEAAAEYPTAWIEDAFREAVSNNKRNWRYIRRILETWASRGRGSSGTTWRRPEPPDDPRRYLEGRHGRLIPR